MDPLNRARIAELIPHAGAMVLLHAVMEWDGNGIRCIARSHRDPGNPLRRGRLWTMAGVEYAGQAMALHGTLSSGVVKQRRVLGALRDVQVRTPWLDDLGPELTVVAHLLGEAAAGAQYSFAIDDAGRVVLSGRGSVFSA
jgi:predicted hotdog family 3-hydroxylacyl-ACP dehydratase